MNEDLISRSALIGLAFWSMFQSFCEMWGDDE